MKKFFHSHPDVIIAVLAVVFLGVIIALYVWALNDVFLEIHRSLSSSESQSATTFNLQGASKLDLRGLMNGTTSAPAAQ